MTHLNLNDGTVEGMRVIGPGAPAFSVQYHPEAGPGPHDAQYLFAMFDAMMDQAGSSGSTTTGSRIGTRSAAVGGDLAATDPDCPHPSSGWPDMPRRNDIESILIIGSGPIVIGQACEFDYSGTQACRVLKEEGYRVILANSNPATIMTDPDFAHRTYIEPLIPDVLASIVDRERPDAVLPTLGGQTGLNLAMALYERGLIGVPGTPGDDRRERRSDRHRRGP